MTSPEAKKAFDIHAEEDALRDEYGRNTLGQSCLMARRLVQAGVRCVTIDHSNWDTHDANFRVLKEQLLAQAGRRPVHAVPRLRRPRHARPTLVIVTGEFGRTPTSTRTPAATTGAQPSRWRWAAAASRAASSSANPTPAPKSRPTNPAA